MSDDIVTRLRGRAALQDAASIHGYPLMREAADTIERLTVALALACNELFGVCDPLTTSPRELMQHFLKEATHE